MYETEIITQEVKKKVIVEFSRETGHFVSTVFTGKRKMVLLELF